MWYVCQWDNSSQETKMAQKFTAIGHCKAYSIKE